MKYKHIVFDIDGTLIDTEYAVINSLIKTITEITGRAPQYESLKFALGITGKNALELLKIPDIEDALKRWDRNMKLLQLFNLFKVSKNACNPFYQEAIF